MPDPVPVASNLLESKFLGFSVRRLLESVAIPIAPCAILFTVGFPLLFTFPLFILGIGAGMLIFVKTPPGQRPLRYAHAVIRHRSGENVYVWAPSTTLENNLASGVRQDDWLTHPPDPGATTYRPRHVAHTAVPVDTDSSADRSVTNEGGEEER